MVNKATKQTTNVETDDSGDYTICLSPGTYDVLANSLGYKPAKRKSINIDAASKAMIDFVMTQDGSAHVNRIYP